jgi:hypothetical protein
MDLPITIHNQPVPKYIKKGDTRGVESTHKWENGKWVAAVRPNGLLVGLIQNLASPMPASWNQIVPWLREIDALRQEA